MTAVFGKLDGDTLHLRSGLNVIAAPNEWGKSTWCAFLCAMLYGIDTRERTTRDQLSEKERYAPWSGKAMSGSIRLLWNDRDITIERTSTPRVPLGQFRAYETQNGLPVPELTAANCGQTLLGVEKNVFRRTGFLRLTELAAPADEALRSRLAALVTTGDDSGSAELLGKKLRELKNRCRHNKTGQIPECIRQIQALEAQASEQTALLGRISALQNQLREQTRTMEELQRHLAFLDFDQAQSDEKRLRDAHQEEAEAWNRAQALEKACAKHPPQQVLSGRIDKAQELLSQVDEAIPAGGSKLPGTLLWLAALVFVLGSFYLFSRENWGAGAALGFASLLFAMFAARTPGKARSRNLERRAEIAKFSGRRAELLESIALWQTQLQELEALEQARRNLKTARSHREALQAMARTADQPEGEDALTLSREETKADIEVLTGSLRQCRAELARSNGRAEHFSDPEVLQRELENQRRRLGELQAYERALELALNALGEANASVQRRFAPRITKLAGEHLAFLTGGAYDRISIDEALTIHAAKAGEPTLRPSRSRSDGTGDLLYLSLRLAIWQTLTDLGPLILDDALARLDQTRLEKAMELLAQIADTRQILLFSCQTREREWMDR